MSPLDDIDDSLDKDVSNSEQMNSSQSLSDVKDSLLDFFLVEDLPNKSSFNEQLREEIEKWKDEMFIEWTKQQRELQIKVTYASHFY